MTHEEIYKAFKHGRRNFPDLKIETVYRALKRHGLQVVLVKGTNGRLLYNYVPEEERFYLAGRENG